MAARCRVGAIASRSILASGNGCARFRETRALGFGVQTRGPNVGVPVCPHASSSGSNRPSMAGRDVWCSASASEAQSLCPARTRRPTRLASGPGGGVLDKPDTAFPKFDLDKDVRTRKKKPPRYQVLLHNDEVNRREYVVKVLLKIVPTLTMDDAVNIMNEAHFNGMAAVIVCAQEEAEEYCEGLRNNGLIATIEPVGGGKGGD
mmetsp:Transcript_8586/g.30964  ORF Transcript_8586/g.30964 Transcript_8586/m.30964 type:complete len:204 (-) Transcript_8586:708-1319(-)